jgi:protein-disulfide isomerase
MQHRWLTFLCFAVVSLVVFIFFWYRNQPIEITTAEQDAIEVGSLTRPTTTFVNPGKGATQPKLTIVEFGDFECIPCKTLADSLQVVVKTYPNDVKVIWKDLPNESVHPLSTPAAIAAHCADRQGAFWQYHDELFLQQSYLTEAQFPQMAQNLGLQMDKFTSCYEARETLPIIKKDYEEGLALGLTATPAIYVGDEEVLIGAVTTQDLLDLVASKLSPP